MQSVQGNVEVRRAGPDTMAAGRLNDSYCAGDRVQVGERSRAVVALVNQPVLRLDQNTTITFGGVKDERRLWSNLSEEHSTSSAACRETWKSLLHSSTPGWKGRKV